MESCSMCGIGIPEGQGVCSMCYGDPYFGGDGYYLAELERDARSQEELEQMERDIEEGNFDEPHNKDPMENNDLPF